MSRLSTLSSNPTLRNFAVGAAQSAIRPIARFLSPTVPVPTMTGRYKEYSAQNQFKVPSTLRGLGGRATRVGFEAKDATYNCEPHALDFPIDNLEKLEGDQLMNMAQYGATLVADIAALSHEAAVVDAALAAAGAGTDSNFASTSVDPVAVIDGEILAVIKAVKNGAPVRVVMGPTAWLRIKANANVQKRLVANTGLRNAQVTMDGFRSLLFSEPEVQMGMLVRDTAREGLDESVSFVIDNTILVFACNESPTTLDPSFMKTFRLMGQDMVPGVYETEDGRGEVLKMDWSEDVKVTNSAAVKRINANAA